MPNMPRLLSITCAAVLFSLAGSAAHAENAALPERKAGLWELKTSMDEGAGPKENEMKLCIDATMETNTVRASDSEHKTNCEQYAVSRANDVTTIQMTCQFNQRHVSSKTEMSGDFKTAFNVRIDSTTADAAANQTRTVTVHRVILQEGKYLAESCGDLEPGQALTADGTKVHVQ